MILPSLAHLYSHNGISVEGGWGLFSPYFAYSMWANLLPTQRLILPRIV
jgi:hypothetical protein